MESGLAFDWDEGNVLHIAEHAVLPNEVEQVFGNEALDINFEAVNGEERWTSIGRTVVMRVLVVVWTMRGERIRTVAAFEAAKRAATEYFRQKGR